MVARVLVKIITSLGTDSLNKAVKDYLIRVMREEPNIDKKDNILTHIYALESKEMEKDPGLGLIQGADKGSGMTEVLKGRAPTELGRRRKEATDPVSTDLITTDRRTTETGEKDMESIMSLTEQKRNAGAEILHQTLEEAERPMQPEGSDQSLISSSPRKVAKGFTISGAPANWLASR